MRTLFALWQSTLQIEDNVRWMYSVVWQEPGFPDIHLRGVVSPRCRAFAPL